ncbi:MAG: carbohydrate ABC transporter permease [Phototrophicaceae bacterium]|jgi:ABC-type sugar transport system permease subunit
MKRSTFFMFVTPSVLIMVALMIVPLIASLVMGLYFVTFRNLDAPTWVGLQNYQEVLQDPEFWSSVQFTVVIVVITVPIRIVLGLTFALLLDQIWRFRGLFMAGALVPFVLTPVVGTLIFRDMFDRGGLYFYLLNEWFGYRLTMNAPTVQLLIMLHIIWVSTPFAMIVLFAGLQSLPAEIVEAARVDGAGWLPQLWYIALPHLRSLFVFITLISIMDTYRIFDSVLVLTQQNPIFNAETIMYYNFQVALSFGRLDKASAISMITVVGIFFTLVPFLIFTYREQLKDA